MKSTLIKLTVLGSLLILINTQKAEAQEAAPLVVMNLAAHPDDEDGRTLTYYRRAKDAIAYSVIYTRGEGGQNEIGPELYEELGAIRTNETERAARILGTQTFFLNFKDFGYSKTATEAFDYWGGEDEVTSRLVYLIRKLKPDVLFTNHDTLTVGPNLQHGQHQAVGISAYKAFDLASDPSYHPEQLEEEGVDLWQPQRLFLRRWRGPASGHYDTVVQVTEEDKATGLSYTRIATTALAEHASQGMGMFASFRRMDQNTYFVLLHSSTDAPLDTLDLAVNLKENKAAKPDLTYWIDSGRVPAPPENFIQVNDEVVVPGQSIALRIDVSSYNHPNLALKLDGPINDTIELEGGEFYDRKVTVSESATPTLPKAERQYDRFISTPPVTYALYDTKTDELLTAGFLPVEIAPTLIVGTQKDVVRLHAGENELNVFVTKFDDNASEAKLNLAVTNNSTRSVIYQKPYTVVFGDFSAQMKNLTFDLPSSLPESDYTISITALPDSATVAPKPASAFVKGRVFSAEVQEELRVGVIESYDNTLSQALTELGVEYVMLDSLGLSKKLYTDLHTILIDIRAYLVRADMRAYNEDLLDWVNDGGHLIVNYQKMFEWNSQFKDPFDNAKNNPDQLAPYPLQLSRDRITTEDSPVTVLTPESPLFHSPNKITDALWEGWVQERGLYFPREYSDEYIELFEMNDPNEAPLKSSTLLASYGQGTYMYTALGWYRQLKEFHPGVYAFFANMISYPLTTAQ